MLFIFLEMCFSLKPSVFIRRLENDFLSDSNAVDVLFRESR